MKKIIPFLGIFLFSNIIYAQILNINNTNDSESFFTPQQLIEEVLISGTCAQVENFSAVSNGTPADNENKSYGYFKRPAGSDFPFEEGIILTSGEAFPAGNNLDPTTIDNNNSLAGDTDLELALGQTGTADATFVKFQFTPSSTSISFRYLMASEEYNQNFECDYADAFAFLLRPVGSATYTNLAIIPETNTPVSTVNVHPLVPGACAAINEDYFEGYNLGDTNYGGRTKVLIASAAVVPNQPYEIKLVIADQGDSEYDSAVFLEAGSFVLNANLGEPKLYVTGNAACGNSFLLDASIMANSYKWYKDGVIIPGENGQTYNANLGNGTYKIEATLGAGCIAEDEIELQFTPEVTATKPTDFALCDEDNNGTIAFDLSLKTSEIEVGQTDVTTTYHESQENANNGVEPLAVPFESVNATIFARVESNISSNCYNTTSFELSVFETPVPKASIDIAGIERCDDTLVGTDADGKTLFNLKLRETDILNGQAASKFEVGYFKDAAFTQVINDPENFENTLPGGQTIFVQMYNVANTSCVDNTSFELIVNSLPVIKNPLVKVEQCDLNVFNLTTYQQDISEGHINETFQYQNADGDMIIDPTNYTSPYSSDSVSETIDVLITTDKGCSRTAQIELKVGVSQMPTSFLPLERFLCETDTALNQDGKMLFDKEIFAQIQNELEIAQPLFLTPGTEFSFYRNEEDALVQNNPIDTSADFETEGNFFNTTMNRWEQSIWTYIENTNIEEITCFGKGQVATLYVEKKPIAHTVTVDRMCDDRPLDIEFSAEFDTSMLENDLLQGQTDITITYLDNLGNPLIDLQGNPINSPFPITFRTTSQTIIAKLVNNNTNAPDGPCEDQTEIIFTVDTTPVAFPVSIAAVCDDNLDGDDTNGWADFDTTGILESVITDPNGIIQQNLSDFDIEFSYIDQTGTLQKVLELPNPLYSNNQIITVLITNPINPTCQAQGNIDLVVNSLPIFEVETDLIVCLNLPPIPIGAANQAATYSYRWTYNGNPLSETTATINIEKGGTYQVTATTTDGTLCSRTKEIAVQESVIATITKTDISIDDLNGTDNNTITIDSSNLGIGDYEFALDMGFFQDEPFFEFVKPGIHTLSVRDKNNCGIVQIDLSVIGFAKFFTPNNDGYNDTWQVLGVSNQFYNDSKIHIFNRFGKLIKQLETDNGWDGTFNGETLPSSDYWFTAELIDHLGITRIRKGHFSLIRRE